jgi:hypothetical protein
MSTPTQEATLTYGGFAIGGSSARKITEYTRSGDEYETSWIEVEFVTTASSAAAFATEMDAVRAAFRKPRQDLTVTSQGSTVLSLKQSDNTGLDAAPSIMKDGDPADTGLSRHFRVRIEFGRPADNVSTSFRRYATIKVEYLPTRQRIITLDGVYTANSTDGTTGSFDQYRSAITAFANSVISDVGGTYERVAEPAVVYNDTDKVCNFSAVYKEIIFEQGNSTDIDWVVDPKMDISIEKVAPGDSTEGRLMMGGGPASAAFRGQTVTESTGLGGGADNVVRPIEIVLSYVCSVNKDVVSPDNLGAQYQNTLRIFLMRQASIAIGGRKTLVVLSENPGYEKYSNLLHVELRLLGYTSNISKMRVTVSDDTDYGRTLVGAYSRNVFDYYDWPNSAVRIRTVREEYVEKVGRGSAKAVVDGLVAAPGSLPNGYGSAQWVLKRRYPEVYVERQGVYGIGGETVYLATIVVVTVLQYRNQVAQTTTAKAGGITGVGIAT